MNQGKSERNTKSYKKWAEDVKVNAGHKCKWCESVEKLHSHHILPYRQFPQLQTDISNGICLCSKCHDLIHGGKFKWKSA